LTWWQRQPFERKLPVIIAGLVTFMALVYTALLYREVEKSASEAIALRQEQVGNEIASLLSNNEQTRHKAVNRLADSVGASQAIKLLAARGLPVLLLDSTGQIQEEAGPPLRATPRAILDAEKAGISAPAGLATGRLFVTNDSIYYWSYARQGSRIIAQRQQIRNTPNGQSGALEKLIGETSVLISNQGDGPGPWIEIQGRPVDRPTDRRTDGKVQTHIRSNTLYLARYTPVPASAWQVVTETPQSAVKSKATQFAAETLPLTLAFILIGIGSAWMIGHRVTRPVRSLANAALAIGSGDYNRRVHVREGGDLGMMAHAFNRMAREVERSRAELDERVRQRTAELEVVNNELQAFSYSVSHDLRSPLRSIDGFSQALLEDYADSLDPTAADYLRRVRGGAQRMGRLIDDLLLLSRVSRQPVQHGTVSLSDMATETVEELRNQDPHRNVNARIEEDLVVTADEGLLRIVLQNLIGNAWKFTTNVEGAAITVGSMTEGSSRVFFVRDNGAGFDMEHAQQLFAPFQRLHSSAQFSGTGIGLATVHRAITRLGGRVWADASVGNGATFYFTIDEG
jgi:signal transduction histidine kinase